MPLKHEFKPMTEADLPTLVPGQWLMNKHLKFVKFLRQDGPPGNLIWCSEVFAHIPTEDVDTEESVLYSVKTLSKIN